MCVCVWVSVILILNMMKTMIKRALVSNVATNGDMAKDVDAF